MRPQDQPCTFLVEKVQACHRRIAEPRGVLQDRVEGGLFLIARARDDLEDLPRRSFALERILKRDVIAYLSL